MGSLRRRRGKVQRSVPAAISKVRWKATNGHDRSVATGSFGTSQFVVGGAMLRRRAGVIT